MTGEYFTRLLTCPETGEDFQVRFRITKEPDVIIRKVEVKGLVTESTDESQSKSEKLPDIEVVEVGEVSPHSEAVYEAGKKMLVDSIDTGREFCQSMIKTSIGAIPIYLGILAFTLPKDYSLGEGVGTAVVLPAIAFLLASTIFTIGYLPVTTYFSLDLVEEIEHERNKVIRRRSRLIKVGFTIFLFATLMAIVVIVMNLGAR
jgi:hypothetical protein